MFAYTINTHKLRVFGAKSERCEIVFWMRNSAYFIIVVCYVTSHSIALHRTVYHVAQCTAAAQHGSLFLAPKLSETSTSTNSYCHLLSKRGTLDVLCTMYKPLLRSAAKRGEHQMLIRPCLSSTLFGAKNPSAGD